MSLRRFRVLVEHLPAGNPLERSRTGGWGDLESLLWHIDSRLGELVAMTFNINRPSDVAAVEPTYLPRPQIDEATSQAQVDYDAAMQAELENLW